MKKTGSIENLAQLPLRYKLPTDKTASKIPSRKETALQEAVADTHCICARKQTEHTSDRPDLPAAGGLPRAAFKCLINQSVKKVGE